MQPTTIKIPSELFATAESSCFDGEVALQKLEAGPDDYLFDSPLSWHVDVTNTGSAFLVTGYVNGSGACPCSRCLESVRHEFEGRIEGYYLIPNQDANFNDEEVDIGEDEFDVLPEDHIIDLLPLITAALMVDAPSTPLCKTDCKGLCPQCGANLNEGPCTCGEDPDLTAFEKASNPFSVLAQLKFDDDESS